jgi:hypothetical protein
LEASPPRASDSVVQAGAGSLDRECFPINEKEQKAFDLTREMIVQTLGRDMRQVPQNSSSFMRSFMSLFSLRTSRLLGREELDFVRTLGLDAIMFLRLLKMAFRFSLAAAILGLCVILPLNIKGGKSGENDEKKDLTFLTLGNVSEENNVYLWGHVVVAYVVHILLIRLLRFEYRYYITRRRTCAIVRIPLILTFHS